MNKFFLFLKVLDRYICIRVSQNTKTFKFLIISLCYAKFLTALRKSWILTDARILTQNAKVRLLKANIQIGFAKIRLFLTNIPIGVAKIIL